MAYSKITIEGEAFIKHVCIEKNGMDGLMGTHMTGKRPYPFPFCNTSAANQTWKCSIKLPNSNKLITTPEELAESLIYWFNSYCKEFELDANVLAAQAYAESGYKIWNFPPSPSTASGVNQFLMGTTYEFIVKNTYSKTHKFTPEEQFAIIGNLEDNLIESSYQVGYYNGNREWSPGFKTAWMNRPLLHQNIINNPGIMIKAQCTFMNYVASLCDALTSTTLFGYSRGQGYAEKTYTASIVACEKVKGRDSLYVREGLNYVMKIFGILGDKYNALAIPGLDGTVSNNYKPREYYFGYDDKMGDTSKNLRLNKTFNLNSADNLQSEQQYGNNPIKQISVNPDTQPFSF